MTNNLITEQFLGQCGFRPRHKESIWRMPWRCWVQYGKAGFDLLGLIVTFDDLYCQRDRCDFFVFVVSGSGGDEHRVQLPYVKTVEQLDSIWFAISGKSLGEHDTSS